MGKTRKEPTLGYVMPPQHIISNIMTRQTWTRHHNRTTLQDGKNEEHSKNAKRQAKHLKFRKKGMKRPVFEFN